MASSDASTLLETHAEDVLYVYDRRQNHTDYEKILNRSECEKFHAFKSVIEKVRRKPSIITHNQ